MIDDQLHSLIDLQKKDLTLLQLKKEAGGIPARQDQLRENAAGARKAEQAAASEVARLERAIKEVELEVEAQKERINKYRNQQMQAKTNEEYKTFESEIATAESKISELEDQELEEMSRLEEAREVHEGTKETLTEAESRVESDVKELENRLGVIRTTFKEVKEDREALAAKLEPSILERYMFLLNKKKSAVVVPVRQQGCGGCHMTLTPQTLHDAHSGQKWANCPHCGRMLYDAEI